MTLRTILPLLALSCLSLTAWPSAARAADAAATAQPPCMGNVFFAMDTGLHDGKHNTAEQRAELLARLGYAGSDHSGTGGVPETLKAYDAKGVRLFGLYVGLQLDGDWQPDAGLKKAIEALKGRDAWLWLAINSKKVKCSDPAGDEQAVAMLQRLADIAAPAGVRLALYPHTGSWVERVEDAVRVATKTQRENVGATFNLCHFLQVDGDASKLPAILKDAMPKLFVVTISGADAGVKGWGKLIQPLDAGTFDIDRVLRTLHELGYKGPIGVQSYGIKGDSDDILGRSIAAWKMLRVRAACPRTDFIGADLTAFRKPTGDWEIVGQVLLDPNDPKRLTSKPGSGSALNGPKGRTGHLVTTFEHGDGYAHVEFVVPKGSNSGVYFQGRYEIQVLDSWGVKKPGSGDCGGIYERWANNRGYEGSAPLVNASREPGKWQTFDVWFRAPKFDASGKKIAEARFLKVLHNGQCVHVDQAVTGPTRSSLFEDEKPLGPIMFQGDHGPVAYRNCWFVSGEVPAPATPAPAEGTK